MNSCTSVKTYPGADINSDQVPVVGNFKVRMKKVTSKSMKKYDFIKLKDPNVRLKVSGNLNTRVLTCKNAKTIEESLTIIQETVREIKEQHLKKDTEKRKSWMTDEILELMDQRKKTKKISKNIREYIQSTGYKH
ncbi:unnamed protein product [Diabrotica balteata]|uniref:Uncharacterized protein n=1 Tax=Diabrotica balteata TaxID=107213 RepID=A0A9N9T5Y7_DIABA|nr:unnamed protein product [Diabrotica balteata]